MFKILKDGNIFYIIQYNATNILIEKHSFKSFDDLKDAIFNRQIPDLKYISQIKASNISIEYKDTIPENNVLWYHYYVNFTAYISCVAQNTTYNGYSLIDLFGAKIVFTELQDILNYFAECITYDHWNRTDIDIVYI